MKEILNYGTFVKVRPSMHLLENNKEEVGEEQRRVSSFVVNVSVKSNGCEGVTFSMTIFSLLVSFLLSMAEPCSLRGTHHSPPPVPPSCSMSFICMINSITSLLSQQL
jgi:hypothetical protein